MTDRGPKPEADGGTAVRETVDRLEETTQLSGDDLRSTYQEFRDRHDDEDPDQFLQYLLEENVIDEETYVTASNEEPVKVADDGFDHLPPRDPFYTLQAAFDKGGMGEICVGHDPHLDRKVAVKVLREEKSESDLERRRFLREAQVTGKLAHPNIVPVHSLHSEDDGRASFAMKLIDGQTLFDVIYDAKKKARKREPLEERLEFRRRIEIFLRVCDAMAYAHNRGVIHRDLKPSNIMVGAYNEVYVMDWGIAKITDAPSDEDETLWESQWEEIDEDDEVKTQAGSLIGTPPYMPPEQARGEHETLDARSDLFSLGAILFELVTLRRMIPGDKVYDVLQNVMNGAREAFEPMVEDEEIEPELQAIIEKATAHDRDERYQSVEELADEVRRYLDDREVKAHPDGPMRKIERWMTHNRETALTLLLAGFVVAASAIMWSLWRQKQVVQQNRHREAQLSKLQTHISGRSHRIDQQFLRFELLVRRLAIGAQQFLAEEPTYAGEIYSSKEFESLATAPPNAQMSSLYDKRVSIDFPVYKLAPGVSLKETESQIRQLMALRGQFRSIFLDSRFADESTPSSPEALWEMLAVDGVPGRWAYVALENGLHFSYPGKGGYPADYDPRKRPWYEVGKSRNKLAWVPPYRDTQGQGLVMPCVTPVRSESGELLGIAGLEVTLDFIKEHFMKPTGPIEATYVLDDEGHILVSSNNGQSAERKELPTFHILSVLQMVEKDESGVYQKTGNPTDVYSVYRMPTLDWFYVAKAPLPELLKWEGANGQP